MPTGLEDAALKLGVNLVNLAIRALVGQHENRKIGSSQLAELTTSRLSFLDRRSADRRIEDLADKIARRLEPLCVNEFRNIDEEQRRVVLLICAEIVENGHFTDTDLFAANLSAAQLVEQLNPGEAALRRTHALDVDSIEFLNRALLEACQCLVQAVMLLGPFVPRGILEALVRTAKLEDKLDELLSRTPRPMFGLDGADSDEFMRLYRRAVCERFDKLDIFGIASTARPALKLSIGYLALSVESEYEPSTVTPPRSVVRGFNLTGSPTTGRKKSVAEAFSSGKRFLIRGEAGCGKSTLLRWLAVSAARNDFTGGLQSWNGLVPFLIKLRSYSGQATLPTFEQCIRATAPGLADVTDSAEWAARIFRTGRALLLVDGVDEVSDARREETREWLAGLLSTYSTIRVVVTTRPSAAGSHWLSGTEFTSLALDPLSPTESRTLIRRWHDAVTHSNQLHPDELTDLPMCEATLLRELDSKAHLRALAASPLLTSMICALNLARAGELPESRKDLYDAALDHLLHQRDRTRGVHVGNVKLDRAGKLTILRGLALDMTMNNLAELPTSDARFRIARILRSLPPSESELDPDELLEYFVARSGVVRQPAEDRLDFVHKTFQEYLAAKEIAEQNHVGMLVDRAHEDRWREVIFMFPLQAADHQQLALIKGLLARAAKNPKHAERLRILAALCAEHSVLADEKLRREARAILHDLLPPTSNEMATTLAQLGDFILPMLPTTVHDLPVATAIATIRTVAFVGGEEALRILGLYASDHREGVQLALVDAWDYFDADLYAQRVLSRARLQDTSIRITSSRPLNVLHRIPSLLTVEIDAAGMRRDRDPRLEEGLQSLRLCTQLRALDLTANRDVPLTFLGEMENLTDLTVYGAQTLKADEAFVKLTTLRKLALTEAALTLDMLRPTLSGLTSLYLAEISGAVDMLDFPEFAPLEVLALNKCEVSNWSSIGTLRQLRVLRLAACRLVPDRPNCSPTSAFDLDALSNCDHLRSLSLLKTDVKVKSFHALRALPALQKLEISVGTSPAALGPLQTSNVEIVYVRD